MDNPEVKIPVDAPDTKEAFFAKMKELVPGLKDEDLAIAWTKHSSMTLTERIVSMMEEYGNSLVATLQKSFADQIAATVKEQESKLVEGVMKGLGLSKDEPVKMSEVEQVVRKVVLELSDPNKKTKVGTSADREPDTPLVKPAIFDFAKRLEKDLAEGGARV